MKLKLAITGIINLITLTGFILFMVGFFKIFNKALDVADNPLDYVIKIIKSDTGFQDLLKYAYIALAGIGLMVVTWMIQIVLGIFIISTSKSVRKNRWVANLTGVLALFGGLAGINAICAFTALFLIKEKKHK